VVTPRPPIGAADPRSRTGRPNAVPLYRP